MPLADGMMQSGGMYIGVSRLARKGNSNTRQQPPTAYVEAVVSYIATTVFPVVTRKHLGRG